MVLIPLIAVCKAGVVSNSVESLINLNKQADRNDSIAVDVSSDRKFTSVITFRGSDLLR